MNPTVTPKPRDPQTCEVGQAANLTRECQWTFTVRRAGRIVFFHVYEKKQHAEEARDAWERGVRL